MDKELYKKMYNCILSDVKAYIANPEPTTFRNQMLEENTCFSVAKNSMTIAVYTYNDKIEKYVDICKKVKKYIDDAGWSSGIAIGYDGTSYILYLNLLPNKVK